MPISGKFYQHQELQSILNVSKQRVSNIAADHNWEGPQPGLYYAESVEPYLMHYRNITPESLTVISWDNPDGKSPAEYRAEYDAVYQQNEAELNEDTFN